MLVTVPNDYSRLQSLAYSTQLVASEYWIVPPQHLHYFDKPSLVGLANSSGFQIVDCFADFPIELYLFHSGSSYVADPSNGPEAHLARMKLSLAVAESAMAEYVELCRSFASCGIAGFVSLRPQIERRRREPQIDETRFLKSFAQGRLGEACLVRHVLVAGRDV